MPNEITPTVRPAADSGIPIKEHALKVSVKDVRSGLVARTRSNSGESLTRGTIRGRPVRMTSPENVGTSDGCSMNCCAMARMMGSLSRTTWPHATRRGTPLSSCTRTVQ